jgi:hypothetical protein
VKNEMKNFIKPNEEFPPINCHVFEDYDHLDSLAEKRGYYPTEQTNDDRFETIGLVGLQNGLLHSGWVATADDCTTKAEDQLKTLKAKIAECLKRKETIIIGFCQTGWFSVGYSIYRKKNKSE